MDSKLLTSIIDFLPDATFVINNEKKVIAWNKAMEEMTRVKREDILGKGDYVYAIPFYSEKRPILIDLVMNESRDMEVCYDYVKKQGNTLYAETYVPSLNDGDGAYLWGTAAPLLDDNGNSQGAIESIRDITERKIVEVKLKDSEEKLRTIFDQTFEFMGLMTVDGILIAANKAALELIGATEADVIGKVFWETPWWSHSNEAQDELKKAVQRAASGGLVRFETTHTDKNGKLHYIDFSLRPLVDEEDNIIYLNPEGRDVTEIKEVGEALKQSEEKFRLLFEKSVDPILLLDGGVYVDCNEAALRLIHCLDKNQLISFPPSDFSPETQPDGSLSSEKSKEYIETAFREGAVCFEWMGFTFDREEIWVEVSLTAIPIQGRQVIYTVLRDIRNRKIAEEVLKNREAELEIKSKNLEEVNTALKILLKERENDKFDLEKKILSNVKELILPYIEKLKKSRLDSSHMTYVNIIEANMNDIVSPFLQKMALKIAHFTPTEIQIANLIKSGSTTKEIGITLSMSSGAINFHRNNIRKKLGLNKSKMNLRSYLVSL
jgi:PAS domain S-box-containing protein